MPVKNSSNNRVLPVNARASDVARATMDAIIPIANRKTDAAFQVQGYRGILYNRLMQGTPCPCKSKQQVAGARLGADGKASQGTLNELMTGGEFGVTRYGTGKKNVPGYEEQKQSGTRTFAIDLAPYGSGAQGAGSAVRQQQAAVARVVGPPVPNYSDQLADGPHDKLRGNNGLPPRRATTMSDEAANLILDEADIDTDYELNQETPFDLGAYGYSDVSCPVCFGSGFVGGFSVMGGIRKVLCAGPMDSDLQLPPEAHIDLLEDVPVVQTKSVTFYLTLPSLVKYVDAFNLWNGTDIVSLPQVIELEDCPCRMSSPKDLLRFCDGKRHKFFLEWPEEVTFTHLEVQLGLSGFDANFELPKTNASSEAILENTSPFQVILSPRVPLVKPLDVVVESTLGKVLEVTSVEAWNDRKRSILGWTADVRPVQPTELLTILPRRMPEEQLNSRGIVTDNFSSRISDGPSRT